MPSQQCLRCGWVWEINTTRNNHDTCESCRARKSQKIRDCIVWQGHYSADMITPIDSEGNEVMPGEKTCRNSDCVNPAHLVTINETKGN